MCFAIEVSIMFDLSFISKLNKTSEIESKISFFSSPLNCLKIILFFSEYLIISLIFKFLILTLKFSASFFSLKLN